MMAYTTYYLAFPSMPLANIVALWFTVPLFVTALAGPFLGEKVGVRRWAAAIVGFAGVLIIVRPLTDSFSLASLLPIASALTYSISALMARRMGETESAPVMSFYQNLVYLLVALVMAVIFGGGAFEGTSNPSLEFLVRGWVTPSWIDLALLAACGVIASIATVLLTQAYRMAEANFVACFEYSAIIWATLGGYLFWREVPDRLFPCRRGLDRRRRPLRAVPHPAGIAAGDREGLASSPARRWPEPACRSAPAASCGSARR